MIPESKVYGRNVLKSIINVLLAQVQQMFNFIVVKHLSGFQCCVQAILSVNQKSNQIREFLLALSFLRMIRVPLKLKFSP